MYNYSELHQIIELQYAKKNQSGNDKWGWGSFFNQSLMLGQGYVTPSNYLNNINNIINKNEDQGNPLYLHNN